MLIFADLHENCAELLQSVGAPGAGQHGVRLESGREDLRRTSQGNSQWDCEFGYEKKLFFKVIKLNSIFHFFSKCPIEEKLQLK